MKIGIIGAGGISSLHAKAYQALGVSIAAVADPNKDAYMSRRQDFGDATYYATDTELLADPNVDMVDICVGTRFHFDVIQRTVAAQKHILCEKTMTHSAECSAKVVEMLRDYKKVFQVGYMKRFFPATIKAVELLPELGTIFSAYITSYQGFERSSDPYTEKGWQAQDGKPSWIKTYACGGMLNMAGSHMLDLMNLFLGAPETVYSQNWSPANYDAETNSHALFRMKNGAVVQFEAAMSPYSRDGLWRDGWDECLEINGTRGKLQVFYVIWDRPTNNAPLVRFYSEKTKSHTEFTFPKVDAIQQQLASFVSTCAEGRKAIPGAAEGYYVDRVIDACYRSADTRQVVQL